MLAPGRGRQCAAARTWSPAGKPSRCPTTDRWPRSLRPGVDPRGCAGGAGRATSTSCTSTSRPRPRLSLLAVLGGPGTDRGDLAHLATVAPRAMQRRVLAPAARPGEDPGRIAVSEAARTTLVEHLGGDAVLIPNGVDCGRFATRRAAAGLAGDCARAVVHRPDRRAPQGTAGRCSARCRRSWSSVRATGCWSPGRATSTQCATRSTRRMREQVEFLGMVSRGGQGPGAALASTCTSRPTPVARVLRDHPARGDGRRTPVLASDSTPSGGCSMTAGPAGCSGWVTAPTWPPLPIELLCGP